jgi:hypothetical protein
MFWSVTKLEDLEDPEELEAQDLPITDFLCGQSF